MKTTETAQEMRAYLHVLISENRDLHRRCLEMLERATKVESELRLAKRNGDFALVWMRKYNKLLSLNPNCKVDSIAAPEGP